MWAAREVFLRCRRQLWLLRDAAGGCHPTLAFVGESQPGLGWGVLWAAVGEVGLSPARAASRVIWAFLQGVHGSAWRAAGTCREAASFGCWGPRRARCPVWAASRSVTIACKMAWLSAREAGAGVARLLAELLDQAHYFLLER